MMVVFITRSVTKHGLKFVWATPTLIGRLIGKKEFFTIGNVAECNCNWHFLAFYIVS